jgi:hypothetical protein
MDGDLPDRLTPTLRELALRQPAAARIVRHLRRVAASGHWDEPLPAHTMDQAQAAIRDRVAACERGDYAPALAHLRVWAGLLGVG